MLNTAVSAGKRARSETSISKGALNIHTNVVLSFVTSRVVELGEWLSKIYVNICTTREASRFWIELMCVCSCLHDILRRSPYVALYTQVFLRQNLIG